MPDDKYIDTIEKDGESYGIRAEEAQIKELIQADKDILNQITFEVTQQASLVITLPTGVLPLTIYFESLYEGDDIFFDYSSMSILNGEQQNVGDIHSNTPGSYIALVFTDVDYSEAIIERLHNNIESHGAGINYIMYNDYTGQLNTYNLYNPASGSGTKLYKHRLELSTADEVYITSTSPTHITDLLSFETVFSSIHSGFVMSANNGVGPLCYFDTNPNNTFRLIYFDSELGLTTVTFTSFVSDTVTEL